MAEKKFKGAPFGTQAARFDVSAVHPANKRVGTYTEIPYCKRKTNGLERNLGPGTYNVDASDFSARAVQKGPGWKRAQETARLAQMPHLLYRDAWENKRFLKTKVGPGTYKTCDFIQELERKPCSVRGVCDTREERFRDMQSWTPGPGSYGKGGIPSAALEERRMQSTGTTGCSPHFMDYRTGVQRFPEGNVDCGLSPGTYNLKSSTDLILSSSTGKRGPYDLFTGRRDRPITCGYFAAPKRVNLNPGEYTKEVQKFGEELQKPEKKKHGQFSSLEQYPSIPTERIYHSTLSQQPRPATFPGPGWYEVTPVTRVTSAGSRTPPPFLSTAPQVSKRTERLQNGNHNMVGPGRYDIADKGRKTVSPHHSSFSSQTQRYLHCPERDKYIQERLRATHIPLDRRSFLVRPDAGRGLHCFSA